MKVSKTISVFGALALGVFSSAASAADYMRVNVPFAFVVAGQQFTPGEYIIKENESGVILVQGTRKAAMVISTPAAPASATSGSSLRFINSRAQLHLTTVTQAGEATRTIPVLPAEQRTLVMSSR